MIYIQCIFLYSIFIYIYIYIYIYILNIKIYIEYISLFIITFENKIWVSHIHTDRQTDRQTHTHTQHMYLHECNRI